MDARPPSHVSADFCDQRQGTPGFDPINRGQVNSRQLVEVAASIEARLIVLGRLAALGGWRRHLLRHPLQLLLYPYLVRAYDGGSPRAPCWIAHLYDHLDNSREWRTWFETQNLTPWALLEEALRREPTNDAARQELILVMARWLDDAIHEVPRGVLYGVNGATIDACQELLDVLDQFRALTRASGALRLWEDRIPEWELHFRGYADDLSHCDHHTN
jgi:hypothetical protein